MPPIQPRDRALIALFIVLGILLLLFLILMIRVQVFATYSDELTLYIKVLFIRIPLIPPADKKPKKEPTPKKKKPKEDKPKENEPDKEPKPSFLSRLKEKKGLTGLLSLLTSVAKIAGTLLKNLFSHIVIHRFDLGIALSGEDASSVALNYGRLCSVVYPAVDIIVAATVCRDYHVTLEPVFDSDRDTEISVDLHAHLRVIFAVWEALKAGVKLLLVRLKL